MKSCLVIFFDFLTIFYNFFAKTVLKTSFGRVKSMQFFMKSMQQACNFVALGGSRSQNFFRGLAPPDPSRFYGGLRPPKTLICNFYLWTIGNPVLLPTKQRCQIDARCVRTAHLNFFSNVLRTHDAHSPLDVRQKNGIFGPFLRTI